MSGGVVKVALGSSAVGDHGTMRTVDLPMPAPEPEPAVLKGAPPAASDDEPREWAVCAGCHMPLAQPYKDQLYARARKHLEAAFEKRAAKAIESHALELERMRGELQAERERSNQRVRDVVDHAAEAFRIAPPSAVRGEDKLPADVLRGIGRRRIRLR